MAEPYFRRQRTMLGAAAYVFAAFESRSTKCLALTGAQRLTLLDDDLVREEDFATNFLLREGDRGKPKAKLFAARLDELSPFADVRTIPGALTLDLLLNYHVVVFSSSQFSREELIAYNEFCRVQSPPIGFVLAESRGTLGSLFTDFSQQHVAEDEHALVEFRVLTKRSQVTSDNATVTLFVKEPHVESALGPGDSVRLRNTAVSDDSSGLDASMVKDRSSSLVCQVESIISPTCVQLRLPVSAAKSESEVQDFRSRVKQATHMQKLKRRSSTAAFHRSFRERIIDPGVIAFPMESASTQKNAASAVHLAMQGLYGFRQEFGVYPESNNCEYLQQMLELVRKFCEMNAQVEQNKGSNREKQTLEPDESLMRSLLRCPASEFQPLSAMIAGYAAIHVMKFAGKMGAPVHPQSQFLYFDLLSILPPEARNNSDSNSNRSSSSEFATPIPTRENALIALFGTNFLRRIQQTVPCFVGMEATNVELLKNALCLGIGAQVHIRVAKHATAASSTDNDNGGAQQQTEGELIDEVGLNARVLFAPQDAGQGQSTQNALLGFVANHFPAAKLEFCSMMETKSCTRQHHDAWSKAHIVCCDSLTLEEKLWVDSQCRAFEKPFLFSDQCAQTARIRVFSPHVSESFSESLIPKEKKSDAQLFAFDHFPLSMEFPSGGTNGANASNSFADFEIGAIVNRSEALFRFAFCDSIALAVDAFSTTVAKSTSVLSATPTGTATLWGVWSVVQRGHNATNFESCLVEAWKICELIPMLLLQCLDNNDANGPVHENTGLLCIDLETSPDQMQLIVSTACIIADSLEIPVPPVDERRKLVAKVASQSSQFSLHSNPRTLAGILKSFEAASAAHLLQVCKRVQPIAFDSNKIERLHCHFLQSLVNIQARMHVYAAPLVPDLAALRCLLPGERADFLPIATILGALAVVEIFKLLQLSKRDELRNYCFTLPSLANGGGLGAYRLEPRRLEAPLQMKSLAREATRGGPLQVVPENFTAWSKISIPLSKELQSVDPVVTFIQMKYQVEVQALMHDKRVFLSLDARKSRAKDKDLSMSIFEMVARSKAAADSAERALADADLPPFLLLEVAAVDVHGGGDVAFAPFRIQRFIDSF